MNSGPAKPLPAPFPMRVIAGKYRRRKLASLDGSATRPMPDRMREALFNILQGRIAGRAVADLFAGTGAVGIEALSRGAGRAVFVESNPAAAGVIRKNLASVGAEADAEVLAAPVERVLPAIAADIYFVTPPYSAVRAYADTLAALAEKEHDTVAAQHARSLELAEAYGAMRKFRAIDFGSNRLSLYRRAG